MKSENRYSKLLHPNGFQPITLLHPIQHVADSVQLNSQHQLMTEKVENEIVNRFLSMKIIPESLLSF